MSYKKTEAVKAHHDSMKKHRRNELVVRMYQDGSTMQKVADEFGISRARVGIITKTYKPREVKPREYESGCCSKHPKGCKFPKECGSL